MAKIKSHYRVKRVRKVPGTREKELTVEKVEVPIGKK
jgi:hypothetical protein